MSTLPDVEALFARARRFQTRILAQRGDGASPKATTVGVG
jgi:hypothetical protein